MKRKDAIVTFVVVTSCRDLKSLRGDLSREMRVLDCGQGTVEYPSGYWFEAMRRDRPLTATDFVDALTTDEVLRSIEAVQEGTGKDMAKQLPLLARAGAGVPCGRAPLSSESKAKLAEGLEDAKAGRVSQMPLFDEM